MIEIPRDVLQSRSGHCAKEESFDAIRYGVDLRDLELQRVLEYPLSRYQDLSDPPASEVRERVKSYRPGGESAIVLRVGYTWSKDLLGPRLSGRYTLPLCSALDTYRIRDALGRRLGFDSCMADISAVLFSRRLSSSPKPYALGRPFSDPPVLSRFSSHA